MINQHGFEMSPGQGSELNPIVEPAEWKMTPAEQVAAEEYRKTMDSLHTQVRSPDLSRFEIAQLNATITLRSREAAEKQYPHMEDKRIIGDRQWFQQKPKE